MGKKLFPLKSFCLDKHQPVGSAESYDIHQSVPTNGQWADGKKYRVNVWVMEHDGSLKVTESFEMDLEHRKCRWGNS